MTSRHRRSYFWILMTITLLLLLGTVGYFATLIMLTGDGDILRAVDSETSPGP